MGGHHPKKVKPRVRPEVSPNSSFRQIEEFTDLPHKKSAGRRAFGGGGAKEMAREGRAKYLKAKF
jgi:hypothetical protein